MIRTLIFGAIAGYVGKKLYDEGKLTEFKNDITARYDQAKADLAAKRDAGAYPSTSSSGSPTPTATTGFNPSAVG